MRSLVEHYYERRLEIFAVLGAVSMLAFFCLENSIAKAFIASCVMFEALLLFFTHLWIMPEEKRKMPLAIFVVLLALIFCCVSLVNSIFGFRFSGNLALFTFSFITFCLCISKIIRRHFFAN